MRFLPAKNCARDTIVMIVDGLQENYSTMLESIDVTNGNRLYQGNQGGVKH